MDWLARIGETDPDCIAAVIRQCSEDREARAYYKRWALGGMTR